MTRQLIIAIALTVAAGTSACDDSSSPEPEQTTAPSEEPQEKPEKEEPEKEEMTAQEKAEAEGGLGPGTKEQQQLLVKAKSAFLNEQWEEAEKQFGKLTETGPISGPQVTAFIALGQIYNDTDRADEAQRLYERLLRKAPDVAEVHFVLARTLAEQGDTTKAMREYEKTIKLQPDYLQAMVELGGLYAKAGRKEEAEKLFYTYEKKVYKLAEKLESKETPPEDKLYLLEIFSFVDDDRANQAIAKTVMDPDPAVRERAIWLAVDLGLGAVKPKLKLLVENDPSRSVRMAAKEALTQLKDAPAEGARPTVAPKKGSD
jgi:tetratricopeptide (TPR) repeat protein